MEGLIINEKQSNLLLSIQRQERPKSLTLLAKLGGYNTFAQAFKVVNRFKEIDLVNLEKKGRIKMISLTKKGKRVCVLLANLKFLLK